MTLLVLVGMLVLLAVFAVFATLALQSATGRELENRLLTARVAASHVDHLLGDGLMHLEKLASREEVRSDNADAEAARRALSEAYRDSAVFNYGIFLLDAQGRVRAQEPPDVAALGEYLASQSVTQSVLATGKRGVSGLLRPPVTAQPLVMLAAPLFGRQGEVAGLLVGVIDLTQLTIQEYVAPLTVGRTGFAQIVDGEGNTLLTTLPGGPIGPSEHPQRFAALIKEGQTTVALCHQCHETDAGLDRERDMLAFAPLSAAPWGIALQQAEEEVLAPVHELQGQVAVFGALAVALALALAWISTRAVVRPLEALTAAAERMAAGNLSEPIPPLGADEVGRLSRAFDHMRARLMSSRKEIERWNHELENRVEERTQQLASRAAESMALYQVCTEISSLSDLDRVLTIILEKARELVGTDTAFLALVDEDRQELTMRVTLGIRSEAIRQLRLRHGQGAGGLAAEQGKALIVSDYAHDARLRDPVVEMAREEGLFSLVVTPLIAAGHTLGVLYVANRHPTEFSAREAELLSWLAVEAAIAIQNARLFAEAGKAQALRELDRLKSELLSTVSHQLRTPLACIKGTATALLRRDTERDERTQRKYLHAIDKETDRLCDLIDDLLDMSKIEAGALRLDKREVMIPALAQRARQEVDARRRRRIQIAFPPDFPHVLGDERRLEQVLCNLLDNALKYAARGPITISGKTADDEVMVTVVDHGLGIPQRDVDRIFEPFYRAENGAGRRIGGTGLGLAICRGIVEVHGGSIWAESQLDKGTALHFTLPLNHNGAERQ